MPLTTTDGSAALAVLLVARTTSTYSSSVAALGGLALARSCESQVLVHGDQ